MTLHPRLAKIESQIPRSVAELAHRWSEAEMDEAARLMVEGRIDDIPDPELRELVRRLDESV